ncbi:unnamed protein product [Dovyalis caffra]|uniref:Uncharacterized protein n=1 Tax=Dovyalis caffra TaxID=77055 RepID=A0AAV1S7J1_9ROSI|nr:unnamed protein product [Dovyalis caffra]
MDFEECLEATGEKLAFIDAVEHICSIWQECKTKAYWVSAFQGNVAFSDDPLTRSGRNSATDLSMVDLHLNSKGGCVSLSVDCKEVWSPNILARIVDQFG